MKLNGRTLPFRTHYFNIPPTNTATPSRAERLHPRFFGGKTRGIAFEAMASLFAVTNFAIGEYAPQKADAKALDALTNARNFGDVQAGANDHDDMLTAKLQLAIGYRVLPRRA